MKRNSVLIVVVLVAVFSMVMTYYLVDLFTPTDKFMAKISFRDKIIEVCFVQAGATTRDVIQVTSSSEKKQKHILRNIENNNFLLGYSVVNDSTLKIVVNKVGRFVNKPDTIEVVVPD